MHRRIVVALVVVRAASAAVAVSYGFTRGETSAQARPGVATAAATSSPPRGSLRPISRARPLVIAHEGGLRRTRRADRGRGRREGRVVALLWVRGRANRTPTTRRRCSESEASQSVHRSSVGATRPGGQGRPRRRGAGVRARVPEEEQADHDRAARGAPVRDSPLRRDRGTEHCSLRQRLESLRIFADDPLLYRPGRTTPTRATASTCSVRRSRERGRGLSRRAPEQVLSPAGLSRTRNDLAGFAVARRSTRFARIACGPGTARRPQRPLSVRRARLDRGGGGAARVRARRPRLPRSGDTGDVLHRERPANGARTGYGLGYRGGRDASRPLRRPHRERRRRHRLPSRPSAVASRDRDDHERRLGDGRPRRPRWGGRCRTRRSSWSRS